MRWTLVVILVVETVRHVVAHDDDDLELPHYEEWQEIPSKANQEQEYHELEQETTTEFLNPWTVGLDTRVFEDDDDDDEDFKPEWEAVEFRTTRAPRTRRTFNWTHRICNWTTRPRTTRKMFTGVTYNSSHVLCTEEPYYLFDPTDVTSYIVVDKTNRYDQFIAYRQRQIETFKQRIDQVEKEVDSLETIEKGLLKGGFDLNSENNMTQLLSIHLREHKFRDEMRTCERIIENFQNQIQVCGQLTNLDIQKDELKRKLTRKDAIFATRNATYTTNKNIIDVSDEYIGMNDSYHNLLTERIPLVRSLNESNREYSELLSKIDLIKYKLYSTDDFEHVMFNINHLLDKLEINLANNVIDIETYEARKEILKKLVHIIRVRILAAQHLKDVKEARFRTNYLKRPVKTNVSFDQYMYDKHCNRTLESFGKKLREIFQVKSLEYEYDYSQTDNCTHDYCRVGVNSANTTRPDKSKIAPIVLNISKAYDVQNNLLKSEHITESKRTLVSDKIIIACKTPGYVRIGLNVTHEGILSTEKVIEARNEKIHPNELSVTEACHDDNELLPFESDSSENEMRKFKEQDYNEILAQKYINELRDLHSYIDAVHERVNKTHERFSQLWDKLGSTIYRADIVDKYNHQNLVKIFGIPANFSLFLTQEGKNLTELIILQRIGNVLNKKLSLKKIKTAYQDWSTDYQRPPIIAEFKTYKDKLKWIKDYMNFILIKPRKPNELPIFTRLKLKPRVVYLPYEIYRTYPLKYKYDRFIIRDDLPQRMNDLILRVKRKINETGNSISSIVWHNNSRVFFRRHYHGRIRRVNYFDNLDKLFEESVKGSTEQRDEELPNYLQKKTTSFGKRWHLMKPKRKFFLRPTKKKTTRYMFWIVTKSTTTRMTETTIDRKMIAKKFKVW